MCANTALSEATSPNGTYKAIVFVRDCGAATDYSTQVALLETDKTLEDEGGNVFVADNGHGNAPIGKNNGLFVEASWISNSLLRIEHDSRVRIFKTEALMHGVKIEYVQARNDG